MHQQHGVWAQAGGVTWGSPGHGDACWCKYSLVTIGSHLVIMNAATLGPRTLFTITVNWQAPSLSAPADNDISRSLELFLLQSWISFSSRFLKFTGAYCGRPPTLRWCHCRTFPLAWAGRRACRDDRKAEITQSVRLVWLPGMLGRLIGLTNKRRPSSHYWPMRGLRSESDMSSDEETDNTFPCSLISVVCTEHNSDRRDIKLHYHVFIVLEQQTRRINAVCLTTNAVAVSQFSNWLIIW